MNVFELYLLKSVIGLSSLYTFYWFMMRNETYYSWNRMFLLFSLIISFVLPMFNFSVQSISSETITNLIEPVVVGKYLPASNPLKANTLSILSIIYISGAVFFSLRLLLNFAKILYLYQRFPRCKYFGFKAVVLNGDQSPFTFFNILFISQVDYESGKIDEMIVHERAHKEEYHSIDILLLEIMTIIQWFNPFIWLFRLALKSEHEFIADSKVLNEGFDNVKYQKLLFEKSLGITSLDLTNAFNYSLLKKRLKMMTAKKSSSLVKIKYLLSMPLLLMTIMLLTTNINSYGQEDKVYTDVDVMAKYKNEDEFRNFIAKNLRYPESAAKNNIMGTIYVQFDVEKNGKVSNVQIVRSDVKKGNVDEVVVTAKSNENPQIDSKSISDLEAEAIRAVKLLEDFTPAQKDGKNVKSQLTIPIVFVLQ